MNQRQLLGGWSEPRPLTKRDRKIFEEAFGDIVGALYIPKLVTTQVVNGTNYAFFCSVELLAPTPNNGFALATAHEALPRRGRDIGKVNKIDIQTYGLMPSGKFGGWSDAEVLTPHEVDVFERAFEGFTGVRYTPCLVSAQIVSGKNYRYFCIAESETSPPRMGLAIVSIYETFPKNYCEISEVRITNIETFGLFEN